MEGWSVSVINKRWNDVKILDVRCALAREITIGNCADRRGLDIGVQLRVGI